ncbi:MAG: hypothetical protein WCJ81_09190 [bacterium]
MSEYGVKVSLPGYDVKTAPDYKISFNSQWPTLKIIASGRIDIPQGSSNPYVLYSHNLGYPPFFYASICVAGTESYSFGSGNAFGVDNNNLVYLGDTTYSGLSAYYYIFDWNLETNFQATLNSVTNKTPISPTNTFGINATVPTKGITSTDYRDFSQKSDCLDLTIQQSGYGIYNNTTPYPEYPNITYFDPTFTHNLGYPPLFDIFIKDYRVNLNYYVRLNFSFNFDVTSSSTGATSTYIYGQVGDDNYRLTTTYTYIIFKDFLKL